MEEPPLSIIIPFFNEAENVAAVLEEVRLRQPQAELIAVDDGSRDATWSGITARSDVVGLRFRENRGQSAALYTGLQRARGRYCATMDGDGQNDPADIAKLLEAIEGQVDVVAMGRRLRRRDRWHRVAGSAIANRVRSAILRDGVTDSGCSLKVFPRAAVNALIPFNGMHRFLPPLLRHAGYQIIEIPVNHRPRAHGISKYSNWGRVWRGIYDLFGVQWLLRRGVRTVPSECHLGDTRPAKTNASARESHAVSR